MSRSGHWFPFFAAFVIVLAVIGGCADNSMEPNDGMPPASVTNEMEAMEYYASADAFVSNEEQTFSDVAMDEASGTFGTSLSPIIPVTWGRFVENLTVTTTTTIETGDTLATVKVDKDITGVLRILAKYSEDDTSTFLIEKPFADHSVRNVLFKRVGRETARFWLNWVPVATSLVDGKTVTPPADQDVNITELQFITPSGNTAATITEPTEFYLRYHWRNLGCGKADADVPQLSSDETFTVRATVVSESADTDLVVLRYGASLVNRMRLPMLLVSQTENEDGTFTRVYEVSTEVRHQPGFFHAGVVALSRKTLYDDDPATYSVNWWGMPYRVL